MKKLIVLATAAFSLMGCAGGPTSPHPKDVKDDEFKRTLPASHADYGQFPMNYIELVKGHFAGTLKDPDSAKYVNISFPRKEHILTKCTTECVAEYGYSTCVTINAKNSYGGYVGAQTHWFFIQNGRFLRIKNTQEAFGNMIYRGRAVNCEDGDGK